jgi:hypothetical protein
MSSDRSVVRLGEDIFANLVEDVVSCVLCVEVLRPLVVEIKGCRATRSGKRWGNEKTATSFDATSTFVCYLFQ